MPRKLAISRGFLSPEESRALVEATPEPQERLLWVLMLDLGLRLNETQGITLAQLHAKVLSLKSKGDKWRHVPVTARVRDLAQQLAALPYCAELTRAIPWRPRTVQARFHAARARAGITRPGLSCHSLRHTYACTLVDAGIPLTDVAALLGHSNVATTSAYLHVAAGHLERAANAIENAQGDEDDVLQTPD